MPSLIVVGIGAAVGVFEVVEVFGLVRALVDVVLVAVAVAVADRGLEDEAEHGAVVGLVEAVERHARVAARARQQQVAVLLHEDLEASQDLRGRATSGEATMELP